MEYHKIYQGDCGYGPDTLYVAEDSRMPIISTSQGRIAVLTWRAKWYSFDKESLFQLTDFIRHVAEDMENPYEQDAPF